MQTDGRYRAQKSGNECERYTSKESSDHRHLSIAGCTAVPFWAKRRRCTHGLGVNRKGCAVGRDAAEIWARSLRMRPVWLGRAAIEETAARL